MATRALVGFIQSDAAGNIVLTSTYNHYDGYPESLGKGLEAHYSMPEEALKIASTGYISYLDPETGEIEAKYKEPADRTKLSEDFDEAMMQVAAKGDSYGADYIYIYNVENSDWAYASVGSGIRGAAEQLRRSLIDLDGGVFGPSLDEINEDYNTKWKNFLNEASDLDKVMSQAFFKLQDEPKEMLSAYKASLTNDIRLNGKDSYADFTVEDFIEDYENYIGDKMDF